MSPATFLLIAATITFFACLAAAMTMCCFVLLCRNGTQRRKLAIERREKDGLRSEKDELIAVVREQADDLRDQDRELRTLLGPGLDPNATLTVADIVGGEADG